MRDAAPFLFAGSLDFRFLALQVPCVLHRRFDAGDVDGPAFRGLEKSGNRAGRNQIREPDFWLPEQLAGGNSIA